MGKKKILILAYSALKSDPRIRKQIIAIGDAHQITVAGYSSFNDSIPFIPLHTPPPFSVARKIKRLFQYFFMRFEAYYWDASKISFLEKIKDREFDLVIANDIETLPMAVKIARGKAKIYFDAHEYHPREFEESFKWRFFKQKQIIFLCKKYFGYANRMSTVNEGIREEYRKNFDVDPIVITNASTFEELEPSTVKSPIRIIHHGAAIAGRRLESMIEMMKYLDGDYTLDFMLAGNTGEYAVHLKQLASADKRIRFIDPVNSTDICKKINDYDIGLYILQSTNFNNLHALPNKFFEFIQARLCLAISPSPEMAKIVNRYTLGIVSKDFTGKTMAEEIKKLDHAKITGFKMSSHQNARELSAEKNIDKIRTIITELTT